MKQIEIAKNAQIATQMIIIHNPNVLYEENDRIVYEETLFYNSTNIWLQWRYHGIPTTLKTGIYQEFSLRNEQRNIMFKDDTIKHGNYYQNLLDGVAKDMNIDGKKLNIINIFTGNK